MPASHPSPANPGPPSVENPHHGAATKSSSVCCSSPLSLRSKAIPLPARTTTRNEPKANATTKPSSLWPDADPTSCSPCSETAPSTNRGQPTSLQRLDENDRSTPPPVSGGFVLSSYKTPPICLLPGPGLASSLAIYPRGSTTRLGCHLRPTVVMLMPRPHSAVEWCQSSTGRLPFGHRRHR